MLNFLCKFGRDESLVLFLPHYFHLSSVLWIKDLYSQQTPFDNARKPQKETQDSKKFKHVRKRTLIQRGLFVVETLCGTEIGY